MKKKSLIIISILAVLILILILILSSASGAFARQYYQQPPMMTSADQYYSVFLEEEGEAIVTQVIEIDNSGTDAITELNVEVPSPQLMLYSVMQETVGSETRTCTRWEQGCIEYGEGQTCIKYDYDGNCMEYEKPCLNYGRTCANYVTNYNHELKYERIGVIPEQFSKSTNLPIQLEEKVESGESTRLILAYKLYDATDKSGAIFNFDFESAKISIPTQYVRVAVNVQDGLYLKGTSSDVNYLPNFNAVSGAFQSKEMDLSAEHSRKVADYVSHVRYALGQVEEASYLDPYESITVSGKYSSSWLMLNLFKILVLAICAGGAVYLLYYAAKRLVIYSQNFVSDIKSKKKKGDLKDHPHNFMLPFLSGLFTTIGIMLLWGLVILVFWIFDRYFYSGEIFAILIILFASMITLAALIGIPIMVGSKHGATIGIFTVLSILVWMFILCVMTFVSLGIIENIY